MPNVPNLPGVPTLGSYAASPVPLLVADAAAVILAFLRPQWGVFLDGLPALPEANSFVSQEYKQDWTIADYPVEEGAFQTYDKVQLPFESRVRITSGGTLAARQALLAAVDAVANSLDLYDIVTPERVYTSVNVSHYDFRREAGRGLGLLTIDVWFLEVRVAPAAQFSSTQQPGEAGQQNIGNVQSQGTSEDLFNRIHVRALGGQ